MSTPYYYYAKVLSVYDGDTMTLQVDLGFNMSFKTSCRLMGIDTAEMKTKDESIKKLATASRDFVRSIALDKTILIKTYKDDKYGRILVDAWTLNDKWQPSEKTISQMMIDQGFAKAYDGGTKDTDFTAMGALNKMDTGLTISLKK